MNAKEFIVYLVLNYLRILAKLQLSKISPIIVGITGSAGKTSLMYAIEAAISSKYKVKVSNKANSESGLPANILGLEFTDYSAIDWLAICIKAPIKLLTNWEKYDVYLAEMAIDGPDEPKNMSYLLKIFKPNISIFLNVSGMHGEFFDHLVKNRLKGDERLNKVIRLIAKEKGKIITELDRGDTGIINSDDTNVAEAVQSTNANLVKFGHDTENDLQISGYDVDWTGTRFKYKFRGIDLDLEFKDKLLPEYFASAFAAAILVGTNLQIDIDEIIDDIQSKFELQPGRMSLIRGINDSKILDSSYNSSYDAAKGIFEMLRLLKSQRKIAVLGDIRELGVQSKRYHSMLAEDAMGIFDEIVLVGPQMRKHFAPEMIRLGYPKDHLHLFDFAGKAGAFLHDLPIEKDDLVIVKGSQNTIYLEIVVKMLMDNPSRADKLLCRRGKFWDNRRKMFEQ